MFLWFFISLNDLSHAHTHTHAQEVNTVHIIQYCRIKSIRLFLYNWIQMIFTLSVTCDKIKIFRCNSNKNRIILSCHLLHLSADCKHYRICCGIAYKSAGSRWAQNIITFQENRLRNCFIAMFCDMIACHKIYDWSCSLSLGCFAYFL